MQKENQHVERVVHCNNCGCNIFEQGIIEVIIGGYAETDVFFGGKRYPTVDFGTTRIDEAENQRVECHNCHKVLCEGEIAAWEIIEFYEGHTEYLETYLNFMGGAPVHGW